MLELSVYNNNNVRNYKFDATFYLKTFSETRASIERKTTTNIIEKAVFSIISQARSVFTTMREDLEARSDCL